MKDAVGRRLLEASPKGGAALGSGGVFLVIESREHAEKRAAQNPAAPQRRSRPSTPAAPRRGDQPALEKLWTSSSPRRATLDPHRRDRRRSP